MTQEDGRSSSHTVTLHDLLRELRDMHDQLRDQRDELRYLRQEIRETRRESVRRGDSVSDELMTVEQVASELRVKPPAVRSWIQTGALRASRPGNGLKPGRKYRVRRADFVAFVAGSRASPTAESTP
jgi:excisionase family DNA binding protein